MRGTKNYRIIFASGRIASVWSGQENLDTQIWSDRLHFDDTADGGIKIRPANPRPDGKFYIGDGDGNHIETIDDTDGMAVDLCYRAGKYSVLFELNPDDQLQSQFDFTKVKSLANYDQQVKDYCRSKQDYSYIGEKWSIISNRTMTQHSQKVDTLLFYDKTMNACEIELGIRNFLREHNCATIAEFVIRNSPKTK